MKKQTIGHPEKHIFIAISLTWILFISFNFFKHHKINLDISYIFKTYGNSQPGVFFELFISYLISLLAFIIFFISVFHIGQTILKLFKIENILKMEFFVFSSVLGYAIVSNLIMIMGFLGILNSTLIITLFSTIAAWAIFSNLQGLKKPELEFPKFSIREKAFMLMLIIAALFNFSMAFTPEMFYDTLNYHLGAPNFFIQHGSLAALPFKTHAQFPLGISMIYIPALIFKGFAAAKLTNFSFSILTVLAIISFAHRFKLNRLTGLIAALIFYMTPTVLFRSWTATNDLGITMFVFLSLYSLILHQDNKKWIFISAIFMGMAIASKYTSIFFVTAAGGALVYLKFKDTKNLIKDLIIWSAIVIAIFSPWLIKNYIRTNNPVYPLATKYFDSPAPYKVSTGSEFNFDERDKVLNKISVIFKLPWKMSILGGDFKTSYGAPDYYMAGAVFIAFLPLLLLIKFKDKKYIMTLLVFSVIAYCIWAIAPNTKFKYFSPAVPPMAILAAFAINEIEKRSKLAASVLIISAAVFCGSNFLFMLPFAVNSYQPASLLSGKITMDEYLSSSRPGYPYPSYAGYKYINENLSTDSYVLIIGDAKCFYIKKKFMAAAAEGTNPIMYYLSISKSAEELFTNLKAEGFTHIFINMNETIRTASYGNLELTKEQIIILKAFWKKYAKYQHNIKDLYIYNLGSQIQNSQWPQNINPILECYKSYKSNDLVNNIKQRQWNIALDKLTALRELGFNEHQFNYLTSVCYFNTGNYIDAKKYAKIAYSQNNNKNYKELLEMIEKQ